MISEIDKKIQYIRKIFKLTQKNFSKKISVDSSYISQIESGKRQPSAALIELICLKFNVNKNWLLKDEGDPFLKRKYEKKIEVSGPEVELYTEEFIELPVYAVAGAGSPREILENEPIEKILIPRKDFKLNIFTIKISGESMEPHVVNGAVVGIDRDDKKLISGKLYGIYLPYEGVVIKRVFICPDKIILKSDNPSFPEILLSHDDLKNNDLIVGRVRWGFQQY